MSYILDALERSERERKQGELPSFRQDQALLYMGKERKSPWLIVVSGVLLLNALVLFYIYYSSNSDEKSVVSANPSGALVKNVVSSPNEASTKPITTLLSSASGQSDSIPIPVSKGVQMPASVVAPSIPSLTRQQPSEQTQSVPVQQVPVQKVMVEQVVNATPQISRVDEQTPSLVVRPGATLGADAVVEAEAIKFERIDPSVAQSAAESPVVEEDVKLSPLVVVSDVPLDGGGSVDEGALLNAEPPIEERENFDGVAYLSKISRSSRPRVPKLIFNSHIYSSMPSARRVMINNIYLREGQVFQGMTLLAIDEEFVVLEKQGQQFKLPVMRDWLG